MFNRDDDFESGSSYLKADYRLECDGSEYDGYLGYAFLMIFVYPIGIPVFYFICLWLQREKIAQSDTNDIDISVAQLERDCSTVSSMKFESTLSSSAQLLWFKKINQRLSIERAYLDPATSPYSSLFGAYKPDF